MSRLILHIGQAKTGSTTLQKALAAHAALLAERGILFPRSRRMTRNHHKLAPAFFDPDHVRIKGLASYDAKRRMAAEEWANVRTEAQTRRPALIVLSSEALFRTLRPAEADRLRPLLDAIAREIRVLAYIRNPVERYLSLVQQALKSRAVIPPLGTLSLVGPIEGYRDHLGVAPELRVYDRRRLKDGDVVTDFAEWAELGALARRAALGDHNVSLSAEAMSVLHRLGAAGPPRDRAGHRRLRRLRAAVRQADSRLPQATRPRLRPEIADRLTRLNGELLPLRDKHGIVFEDIDYTVAGRTDRLAPLEIRDVESLCPLDAQRRDEMEARVRRALLPLWRRLLP